MDSKYWEDLNKFPPLSREEELKTAIKAKEGDKKSYDLLINSNLRFVVDVAKEYEHKGLAFEDLVAYGNLGLCKAFKKFDPERGMKFITYAVWWIKQSILQALSEDNHLIKIPHYQVVTKTSVEKTKEKLEQQHQREITNSEVEEEMGKTNKNSSASAYHVVSLDKSFTSDGSSSMNNIIGDENAIDPNAETDHISFLEELDNLLSDFTEREREIIKLYHGIGQVRGMTLEEIGIDLGITRERVRQIKQRALERLQHESRKSKLRPYLAILQSEILNDISSTERYTD